MNFAAPFYRPKARTQTVRRQLSQQDLYMYEAIIGKAATVATASVTETRLAPGTTPTPIVARRWKPAMADLTVRIRTALEQSTQNVKPQVTEWWRQVSDKAARRLDEAHARLNAARQPSIRLRVVAREVTLDQPAEMARPAKAA